MATITEYNKVLTRNLSALLFVLAFFIYYNTINHGYVLDDFSTISENSVTQKGVKAIPTIFSNFYRYGYYIKSDGLYRPLSVSIFAIEWSIAPNKPAFAHFINVLLYALSGLVLFKTVCKLLSRYNVFIPFAISLLFITHPIHTEVVANIKSLDELLAFLFAISALNFLIDYVNDNKIIKLVFALFLFFCALLSKESAITMIVLLPIILYYFTKIDKNKMILTTIGLFSIGIVYFGIRLQVLSGVPVEPVTSLENPMLLANSYLQKSATSVSILGKYLSLLILPITLVYDYSFNQIPIKNSFDTETIFFAVLFIAAIVFTLIGLFKRDIYTFGILFFLVSISIISNFILPIGTFMAERLIYCASFGFCFLIAFVIVKITKTQISELKYASLSNFYTINKKAIFVLVSIAMLYSVKTVSRNKDWKDNYTLFANDVENMANNAKAHIFLGNEILKTIVPSQTDQAGFVNQNLFAIDELKKGLSIYPKSIDACNAIGAAYLSIDSIQQAEFYYQKGFDLDKSNPNSIADFYFKKGDFEKAIDFYELILNKNPSDLNALTNGGIAYGAIKKYDKTITNLTLASSIDNTNPIIYWYLSAAYKFKGDSLNSEKFFLKAYELDPQTARP